MNDFERSTAFYKLRTVWQAHNMPKRKLKSKVKTNKNKCKKSDIFLPWYRHFLM